MKRPIIEVTAGLGRLLKLRVPILPNFIISDRDGLYIPVSSFTDAELRQIGDAWTNELVRHAARKRGADK